MDRTKENTFNFICNSYFTNDEELILSLQEKDEDAFRKLVQRFSNSVYNTSISIVQNAADAEDISQEVFIEIFNSVPGFKGESVLSTWIYRIAVNKSLEFLRKKKRKKRFAYVQNLFGLENILPAPDFFHPGILMENKERAAILFKAIERLPENQKSAFILHKVEYLSYLEIAGVMKVSVTSVESLMFRAKQNLQKYLSAYYYENEK